MSTKIKICVVDFINSKPLIEGLDQEQNVELVFDLPHRCLEALVSQQCDVALLPSIEFARSIDLVMIPEISISSRGPIHSVILLLNRKLSEVKRIAVDHRSRSSVALLTILAHEYFHQEFELIPMLPNAMEMLSQCDAALLIGDQALEKNSGLNIIDLGEAWQAYSGLPFVYAFWATRADVDLVKVKKYLISAKRRGLEQISHIIQSCQLEGLSQQKIENYFLKAVHYDWSDQHELGLQLFYQLAKVHGLIQPELISNVEENSTKSIRC